MSNANSSFKALRISLRQISPTPHAEGPPQAARKYTAAASYQCASGETAQCDENDLPACDRRRPVSLALDAKAPMTDLCRGSTGFAHQGCARRPTTTRPTVSTDDLRARSSGTERGNRRAPAVFYP